MKHSKIQVSFTKQLTFSCWFEGSELQIVLPNPGVNHGGVVLGSSGGGAILGRDFELVIGTCNRLRFSLEHRHKTQGCMFLFVVFIHRELGDFDHLRSVGVVDWLPTAEQGASGGGGNVNHNRQNREKRE